MDCPGCRRFLSFPEGAS
ncbi:hypothetical protein [Herbaspirillum sp.]